MSKPVEVSIENLNNPELKRFTLNYPISDLTVEYNDPNRARRSKLATKIFGFPWTQKVVVGTNYVDVTKQDWVEWDILAQPLAGLIKEHLQTLLEDAPGLVKIEENPIIEPVSSAPKKHDNGDSFEVDMSDPLAEKVMAILESQINPAVAGHGGKISLLGVRDQKVYIRMEGGCHGCSSSKITLKQGVETMIKNSVPEIVEVVDATDHSTGENPYYT